MNFDYLSKKINLDPNACLVFNRTNMHESIYKKMKTLFNENETLFFNEINHRYGQGYQELLYLYLRFAIDIFDEYCKKGIPEDIYFDTMSDISVWVNNCYKETKIWGIKEKYWLSEHLHLRLFKIGRLQFQQAQYRPELLSKPIVIYNIPLRENSDIYLVHIQQGEPLTEELCEESYRKAKSFFGHDLILLCDSWLLSPRLKEILKPESNIICFASRYQLIDVDENSDSIHRYLNESKSKLAIAVKDYEASNKKIGTARGYYKYS